MAAAALGGFARAAAKELGPGGATANLVAVRGDAAAAAPTLEFLLSGRGAYVTGATVAVDGEAAAGDEARRVLLPRGYSVDESAAPPRPRRGYSVEASPHVATRISRGDESAARPRRGDSVKASPHVAAAFGRDRRAPQVRRGVDHSPVAGLRVVVTGGAAGIGAAAAARLREDGAHVFVCDLSDAPGVDAVLDVASDDAPARLRNLARDALGGVDAVVHNAGLTRDRTLFKMKRDEWDSVMNVNALAPWRLTRGLELSDDASVVLLGSTSGVAGNAGQANYVGAPASRERELAAPPRPRFGSSSEERFDARSNVAAADAARPWKGIQTCGGSNVAAAAATRICPRMGVLMRA